MNIQNLVGTKAAIQIGTEEEFDQISDLLGYTWKDDSDTYYTYGSDTCISTLHKRFGPSRRYSKKGYTIYKAEDFLNKSFGNVSASETATGLSARVSGVKDVAIDQLNRNQDLVGAIIAFIIIGITTIFSTKKK